MTITAEIRSSASMPPNTAPSAWSRPRDTPRTATFDRIRLLIRLSAATTTVNAIVYPTISAYEGGILGKNWFTRAPRG